MADKPNRRRTWRPLTWPISVSCNANTILRRPGFPGRQPNLAAAGLEGLARRPTRPRRRHTVVRGLWCRTVQSPPRRRERPSQSSPPGKPRRTPRRRCNRPQADQRRRHLAVLDAAAGKRYRRSSDPLLAGPHAQATEDTVPLGDGDGGKVRDRDSHPHPKLLEFLGVGRRANKSLSTPCRARVALGVDVYRQIALHQIIAGGNHLPPTPTVRLHHAEAARGIGLQRRVMAQRGNPHAVAAGDVKDRRASCQRRRIGRQWSL